MNIDVDDPSTWPTDIAALAKLASQPEFDAEDAIETPAPVEAAPEAPVEKIETPRDDKGRFVKADEPAAVEPESTDPVVMTPDGKSVLSFDVLRFERERVAALEAELARLQGLPQQPAVVPAPPAEPVEAAPEFSAEQTARIEKLVKDWGVDIAEVYRDSIRASNRAEQARLRAEKAEQMADDLRRQSEERVARNRRSEDEQIQAAMDNTPLLAAWQADKGSPYFKRAVALHQQLTENDPSYAKLPWGEKFAALAPKVEAVYGASPHSAKFAKVAPASAPPPPALAPKVATPAPLEAPLSLSDLPAGSAPIADESLEVARMSGAQLQLHLARLAANPDALSNFLRRATLPQQAH